MSDGGNILGINFVHLLAGFAGGTVAALTVAKDEPRELLIRIIVGGLTANYLGGPAEAYVAEHVYDLGHFTSFSIGICGMIVCQGVVMWARIRSRRFTVDRKETPK